MDCSTPGSSLLHYLEELAQTQACQIAVAIQPSRPLLPPSPPTLNLSRHQGLFQWAGSLHQVTRGIGASASPSVLPMNGQGWFPFRLTALSPCCSRGSPESSPAPQSENISSLVLSLLYVQLSRPYITTWKTIAVTIQTLVGKEMFLLFNMPLDGYLGATCINSGRLIFPYREIGKIIPLIVMGGS